ncbi:MAG TPA: hypothetical protein PKW63_07115, partial [Vicinamibacterales bacterium]|nr:hypothetical protein [Vicinamibacterales bacterium]
MIPLLYRLLLRFYPREFRDRFGEEFLDTARAMDRGAARRPWRAVRDAVSTAMAVRADLRQERADLAVTLRRAGRVVRRAQDDGLRPVGDRGRHGGQVVTLALG